MLEFTTERDMFELMAQKLAASVISDILDTLGYRDQVMRATIRPLYPGAVVVGRPLTVLYAEVLKSLRNPIRPQDGATETVEAALQKVETECLTEGALQRGVLLRDVFARYGVL